MEEAWKAGKTKLIGAGIEPHITDRLFEQKKYFDPDKEWQILERLKIKLTTIKSPNYPHSLLNIPSPPALLYYRGRLPQENEFLLGVVGSRRHSEYGKRCVNKIIKEISAKGIRVVSGLALGIDALAHRACLDSNTPTFAILASGVDQFSPSTNSFLGREICQKGGVLSEYPPKTGAQKQNFHARNRIISGLSCGLVVIEAGLKSGTFLTVNHALEQGRDIFAIPGEIFSPFSQGSNQLIKDGARLVSSATEILESLSMFTPSFKGKIIPKTIFVPQNSLQRIIIQHLTPVPVPIDKLVRLTKLKVNVLLSQLTEMELLGVVSQSLDQFYLNQ
jgi:DNA processing protein